MGYGKEGNLQSNTFMFLEVSVISWLIVNKEEKWTSRVMKEYFLATLQTTKPIESLTLELNS